MHRRIKIIILSTIFFLVAASLIFPRFPVAAAKTAGAQPKSQEQGAQIKDSAREQIQSLLNEKASRTPAQQKIDSQLLYAIKQQRGEAISPQVQGLAVGVEIKDTGLTLVDIKANVTKALLSKIAALGGNIVYSSARENSIRAYLPYNKVETLAASSSVKFVEPAAEATTQRPSPGRMDPNDGGDSAPPASGGTAPPATPQTSTPQAKVNPLLQRGLSADFAARAARVRAQLTGHPLLARVAAAPVPQQSTNGVTGAVISEGVATHRAGEARETFQATGSGVKIGVLSDGVDSLAALQAAGELPSDVTVLSGQAGSGSEGTAMMEIIHDLAPGAKLYFATAFSGVASFSDNIRALRAAGCNIIVDDVFYFNESPFQDGPIARAVNDVTSGGALYFSSAGNAGNKDDATSGVWEGDFADGGSTADFLNTTGTPVIGQAGRLLDFDPGPGVAIQNPISRTSASALPATLFWADPLGKSANDYDLFLVNETGTAVIASSTNVQNGTQDPYEQLSVPPSPAPSGRRIVVVKKLSAQPRYLHVNLNRNRFAPTSPNALISAFSTTNQTKGHSAAIAAFSTAASPAGPVRFNATDAPGPYPNAFNPINVTETFSSDGPRRIFFNPDGTPITPGNFSSTGGMIRLKPDITAADGVSTATPGFATFFGTSAAAPHAAAIAGLMLSGNPFLTPDQVRSVLTSTGIDIEAPGIDRDSGSNIVMAVDALGATGAQPSPAFLDHGAAVTTPTGGNGDVYIEPGEDGAINVLLSNRGGVTATNISATLTTTTPGVTITQGTVGYPDLARETSATNATPFAFSLASNAACGLTINFTLTVSYDGGTGLTGENLSPLAFSFKVQTGKPGTGATTVSYGGDPVAIPDDDFFGVDIPLEVSGVAGNLSKLVFSFDGDSCSTAEGATGVGLDHTYVGDLVIFLTSPQGTTIVLAANAGGAGNNFCNTMFDDAAGISIQSITAAGAPYTGSFRPATPLSSFNGENPNGTWFLSVVDTGAEDTGSVRKFSLKLTPFECSVATPTAATTTLKASKARIAVAGVKAKSAAPGANSPSRHRASRPLQADAQKDQQDVTVP